MKKKLVIDWGICIGLAIITVLLFCSRTSPLHSILMGDYEKNTASAAMLMGKYWIEGSIPYKDLFVVGGPIYYIIQAVGWLIGKRIGICILEIISLSVFFVFMKKVLDRFICLKITYGLLSLAAVLVVAMGSGGNSIYEWTLPCIAILLHSFVKLFADEEKKYIKIFIIAGMINGYCILSHFGSGGIIFGMILFMLYWRVKKYGFEQLVRDIIALGIGTGIIILPIISYFYVNDALWDMIQGTFGYTMYEMTLGFNSIEVIIHKLIKTVLMFPLMVYGLYKIKMGDYKWGGFCIAMTLGNSIFLLLGNNYWYYYLTAIPAVLFASAMFLSERKRGSIMCSAITILIAIGISIIPLKNYINFLVEGVSEAVDEFCVDVINYRAYYEDFSMMTLNTDSSYYLYFDEKPVFRYFAYQATLFEYNEEIEKETLQFIDESKVNLLLTTKSGWLSEGFNNFTLVQVYCKKDGNLCIFLPND